MQARTIALTLLLCAISMPAAAQQTGGGTLTIAPGAVLEDASTGINHAFQLQASEFTQPGIGAATLLLMGGGIQLCTTQAAGPLVLGQPVPPSICGTAGGMFVRIDKCKATIEAHGSTHADVPHTPFLGAVTIDISFSRTAGNGSDGQLEITVHTPKRQIQLKGRVIGAVTMPTCNM